MAVAELLGVLPGEKVLDLCAAPGGKSTQVAGKLCQTGFLVSNEIHPAVRRSYPRISNGWAWETAWSPMRILAGWFLIFQSFLTGICSGCPVFW